MPKQITYFHLKCVRCGTVEVRRAEECKEMPFCSCGMPMTLQRVNTRTVKS